MVTTSKLESRFWEVDSWSGNRRYAPFLALGLAVFSHDSRLFAASLSRTKVQLVETSSGRSLAVLESASPQSSLCFTPDASQLVVQGERGILRVWNLRLIRRQLKTMNLDWDLPPYRPTAESNSQTILKVTVDVGQPDVQP